MAEARLGTFDASTATVQLGAFIIGSAVSILSVTTNSQASVVTPGENAVVSLSEAATATGVELQNSAGTFTASLPIQSNTTDSVTVQGLRGQLRFGDTDNKVVVTFDDASTAEATGITLSAPTGTFYVNGSSPDTTSTNSVFYETLSAPAGAYQLIWTDPNGVDPTINGNGTVTDIAEPGDIPIQGWDAADGTTSAVATYTAALQATESDDWRFTMDWPVIPITWEWGNRHPITGSRVRLFKTR